MGWWYDSTSKTRILVRFFREGEKLFLEFPVKGSATPGRKKMSTNKISRIHTTKCNDKHYVAFGLVMADGTQAHLKCEKKNSRGTISRVRARLQQLVGQIKA